VSGDRTVRDEVEELDTGALEAISSPAAPRTSARPPAPPTAREPGWGEIALPSEPRGATLAATVQAIPRVAHTVRDDAPARGEFTDPGVPAELELAPTPPLSDVQATRRDAGGPLAAAAAPPPSVPRLATVEVRSLGPTAIADDGVAYFCESCAGYVAKAEVRVMSSTEGRVAVPACPTCGRHLRTERSRRTRALEWVLLEALGWPFSRAMMPTLLGQTLVFWFFSSWWIVGLAPVTLVGLVFGLGVLATYGAAVIRSTHRGDDEPPPPSDLTSSWDVTGALARHIAVLFVGGMPLVAALGSSLLGNWTATERTILVVIGIATLCLYVPAGQIVASTRESFTAALNPIPPIRFAFRLGGSYLLACAILLGVAIAHLVAMGFTMMMGVAILGRASVLWGLVVSLVVVVGFLVEARMLGLVVREHRFDVSLI